MGVSVIPTVRDVKQFRNMLKPMVYTIRSMAYRPPGSRKLTTNSSRAGVGLQLPETRRKSVKPMNLDVNDEETFPAMSHKLGEICSCGTPVSICTCMPETKRTLDFASATSQQEEIPAQEEIPVQEEQLDDGIPCGWMSARTRHRGIINNCTRPAMSDTPSPRTVKRIVTRMVERWQSERDSMNELLGDMSPYWNALPIGEETDDDA